jgi:hypothetical protein
MAILLIGTYLLNSCREDFVTTEPYSKLHFSKDTVFLDTVFTNIGSSTYRLKVYNNNDNGVTIPSLRLGRGEQSFYRLNVDGIPGKVFSDIPVGPRDSIFIFIETTIDYQQVTDPIYVDSIVFSNGIEEQDVKLITLVKDAHFLYPTRFSNGLKETIPLGTNSSGESIAISGFYLDDDSIFTDEKPYVIYGYCGIPPGKTLTIEAGATLHFHQNAGLIVAKGGQLIIEGELENKVMLEGDRLEHAFGELPGQWGGIWLRAGSFANQINQAVIKNATIGILADSIGSLTEPTLTISNTEIYNSSHFGMLTRTAAVEGSNLVINNSGNSSLALTAGGSYQFIHSTFANYWYRGIREYPSVLVNNYYSYSEQNLNYVVPRNLEKANFINCFIDGNNFSELLLDRVDGASFEYYFTNNGIKFKSSSSPGPSDLYDFENLTHYSENIINPISDFKSPDHNELIIGELSVGIGKAAALGSIAVPVDLVGVNRSIPADIGAYQHIVLERKN